MKQIKTNKSHSLELWIKLIKFRNNENKNKSFNQILNI